MSRIDLAGEWALLQCEEGNKVQDPGIPIQIPGDTISALIKGGKIPDPFFGTNELDTLWVGRADWLLSRTVTIERSFLENRQVYLHIDSLDTVAEIRINGEPVATSSNMFAALRIDIRKYLKTGKNLFEIFLRSAERRAGELSGQLPYPVPHSIYPVQSPHRNLIRKVQCHSGWDWGPCLMVSGIYGQVYIASCELGRIEYVTTEQIPKGKDWTLVVTVEYFAYVSGTVPLEITIAGQILDRRIEVEPGTNVIREIMEIRGPELWWPREYGNPSLYELVVKGGEDRIEKRIGFRTVEVLLEDDEAGRSMSFVINGRKIFCKGANWIPVDALPGRHTTEKYKSLLSDAVTANMNMLRVWGGGQYEAEVFYRLCDEMGLLIWQDFMFGCSTYPATRWFLEEVEREVRHQVKRLMDHPCLALWCGNNENLGALKWYPESKAHPARYLVDYDRLNEGVVGRIVRELDPSRPWWPSSPSAGEGDYSDNWHDDSKGDMHYWSVWHEGKNFEAYYEVIPRFCSEFGFQSFPSLDTVRQYAPEDQWNVTSPVMEHHQRHPRGNSIIVETMTRYFRMPDSFEGFLFLSQVQQALAMKTAAEYWRSRKPVCMGILYWQLNDLWPVASWSSIEYSGKWKLLHYAARKFYAPLQVAAFCTDGQTVEVVGLNDTSESCKGVLQVRFYDFGGKIHQEQTEQVCLKAEIASPLLRCRLDELPVPREELFLFLEFLPSGGGESSSRQGVVNELFLCPPKRCDLQAPEIRRELRLEEDRIAIELRTDVPAFYVSLDAEGLPGVFDDNFFTLLPGEPKTVRFLPREAAAADLFNLVERGLKLYHLRGTYR
ncbi:MAG: glycoside hydrolase family 2 protein [Spirochaetaceae bacterium]|nr:MAG: glycoside hydrolase family 2 protein [Spirochaetaceae bacterium]